MNVDILFYVFVGYLLKFADCACTHFPTTWDGTWYDSQFHEEISNGLITFVQSEKRISAGWTIPLHDTIQTDFTCVLSSDGLLVFQSSGTSSNFGQQTYALVCIAITQKTTYSYMYYRRGGTDTTDGSRIHYFSTTDTLGSDTSAYCSGATTTEDFGVLVQHGRYGEVGITLPNPFLGIYNYTFTRDGSTFQCSGSSAMDGCTDTSIVKLNTSLCNSELLDADNREFYCVAYASSGSTYYMAMIHSDSSTTHRSTCVTATISGQIVTASTDPGSCKAGQTSSSRTSHSASVLITMVPYEICYSSSGSTRISSFENDLFLTLMVWIFITCCVYLQ